MKNLRTTRLMLLKAALLLLIGLFSIVLLLVENPKQRTALFLGLAIWAFCQTYHFAFHLIDLYVDRRFRFSGLFVLMLPHVLIREKEGELSGADCIPPSDNVSRRAPSPHSRCVSDQTIPVVFQANLFHRQSSLCQTLLDSRRLARVEWIPE